MAIKTSLQKHNAVDTSKEELGVWHPFDGDIEIRIRRLSSKISQNARKEAEKPHAAALRMKETPPEVYDQILISKSLAASSRIGRASPTKKVTKFLIREILRSRSFLGTK